MIIQDEGILFICQYCGAGFGDVVLASCAEKAMSMGMEDEAHRMLDCACCKDCAGDVRFGVACHVSQNVTDKM